MSVTNINVNYKNLLWDTFIFILEKPATRRCWHHWGTFLQKFYYERCRHLRSDEQQTEDFLSRSCCHVILHPARKPDQPEAAMQTKDRIEVFEIAIPPPEVRKCPNWTSEIVFFSNCCYRQIKQAWNELIEWRSTCLEFSGTKDGITNGQEQHIQLVHYVWFMYD